MPAFHHSLNKRTDAGATFSATFGALAASVLIVCAVWGFFIPRWRSKKARGRVSNRSIHGVTFDGTTGAQLTTFPPHPAVKPLLSKEIRDRNALVKNPQTERPSPSQRLSQPSPIYDPRRTSAIVAATPSSNGLFTPQRQSVVDRRIAKNQFHTIPRASDARDFAEVSNVSNVYGDAKDFILAVPEPLILRPKDCTDSVTADVDHSEPLVNVSPSTSNKLLHPNKLFTAVEKGEYRGSLYSTSSLRLDHRKSDLVRSMTVQEVTEAVDIALAEGKNDKDTDGDMKNDEPYQQGDTAMNRLRSYRSLIGSRQPKLARAGTLSRPKTPVDDLRKFYSEGYDKEYVPMICLSRELTQSTALTHGETTSGSESLSTPSSSPTMVPSTLHLLPTPLKPSRSFANTKQVDVVRSQSSNTTGSVTSDKDGGTNTDEEIIDSENISATPKGMIRGKKPVPLKLTAGSISMNGRDSRRSMTDFGPILSPPMFMPGHLKSRVRASSMYSRDTQGHSLATTPTTPNLPSPMVDIFSGHESFGNPYKNRDSVRAQASRWEQFIDSQSTSSLSNTRTTSQSREPLISHAAKQGSRSDESLNSGLTEDAKNVSIGRRNSHAAPGGAIWV